MMAFDCPYLKAQVELSGEREQHVAERHPDLLPQYRWSIAATLADPDQVRTSPRFAGARLFSRWFDAVWEGKYVVVVVVSEGTPGGRYWIITAYLARRLGKGEIEWQKD